MVEGTADVRLLLRAGGWCVGGGLLNLLQLWIHRRMEVGDLLGSMRAAMAAEGNLAWALHRACTRRGRTDAAGRYRRMALSAWEKCGAGAAEQRRDSGAWVREGTVVHRGADLRAWRLLDFRGEWGGRLRNLGRGRQCTFCGSIDRRAFKRCAGCGVFYCKKRCQKLDWRRGHKYECQ